MKPARILSAFLPFALLAACTAPVAAPPVISAPATASEQGASNLAAGDLSGLVAQIDIPYETFTLANGLTVIVHTDRKSPIVGVTTYYRVGSKNEPRGRTGFAHLFEHIMFNGSENVENFDIPMEGAGSTPTNGSTWYDRTNYVETLPTGALDRALMMESDRMGYLLGAVTQEDLDRQRGVVQNEKRQGDNQPYALAEYSVNDRLLPVGHPYRHATIGSMADLSAASLEDVRSWFTNNYGPNNVVLALAGDIDVATARAAVERWFGDIPRGPDVPPVAAEPVTLAEPIYEEMADQVSQVRVSRNWTGPGMTHPDSVPLQVGTYILGGLYSSRLDNAMVYGEELATRVSAGTQAHEQISFISADFDLAPGADREAAEALFNAEIERLITEGPTTEEISRAATQLISGQLGGLERVGGMDGKGAKLAESLLYTGDPEFYRKDLQRIAALTPAEVRDAMQRWMTRPAYTLVVVPGERTLDGALMGGWGDEATVPSRAPDAGGGVTAQRTGPPRAIPDVADVSDLEFPDARRARLANGIEVELVQRSTVPLVTIALSLDAGSSVDARAEAGKHELMMDMLTEGTATRGPLDIVIEQEELGASISASTGVDASRVYLSSLTSNLPQSLELMADVTLNPSFADDAFARVQGQRLAEIEDERTSPGSLATRALGPLLYGPDHPYAMAATIGDYDVIEQLTPQMLRAEHAEWFRPDLAKFTVVGDIDMAELLPLLNQAFGSWTAPAAPPPAKAINQPTPPAQARLVVIDRPNSPQSVLLLGRLLPLKGTDRGTEALELANEVIGNGFLSRLNDDLRETRGWTYGVRSSIAPRLASTSFTVSTAVQSDRTADSIRVILEQLEAFPAQRPVDELELQRVTDGNIRGLPNRFETNGQVLAALLGNDLLDRPDDYQESLPSIYRAIDANAINAAATQYLHPRALTIVVVGDRAQIDEQIATLGMDVTYLDAEEL
ncbi:pitrilysin family protein [Alteraurantiacibacter aestuarii]|nr:pitrilysin family protein [Alteraurantiacibacter aestuarii]